MSDHHDSAAEAAREDQLLTLLRDAANASSNAVIDNRDDYQNRLLSFHASTYYAKPACLSPLFCARFGWKNADNDMLSCSICSSAVAILPMPPKFSTTSLDNICRAYRQKIVTGHTKECPFRMDFDIVHSEDTSFVVPPYMASVLPEESVLLLEHPAPHAILRQRIQEIQSIQSSRNTNDDSTTASQIWKYPHLQIPSEIQQFASTLAKDILGTQDESILGLAVLGWKPVERTIVDNNSHRISMGCSLCMAFMELECTLASSYSLQKEKEQDDRPNKRLRKLAKYCDPQESHRHYCPYKCGFPVSMTDKKDPVWKIVLTRLSDVNDQDGTPLEDLRTDLSNGAVPLEDLDESICNIRKILRAGIAPTTIDLSP